MSIFYCLSKRKRWLLLLSVLLSLQSKAFTQDSSRITVQGNNIPIETALRQIEKQSGFSFVYGKPTLDDTERITVDISGKGFTAVMDALLGARGIVWSFRGGAVVLSRRGEDVKMVADTVPRITVTGTVVDGQGKPLAASTILVKGTMQGTSTDGEGRFSLGNVPANGVLVVSSIGYDNKQVKISGKSTISITLNEVVTELKNVEVVSTGYQDIPKERATGSFFKIDNELINRSVSTNIIDRLNGVVGGLNVEPGPRTAGQANRSSITIRGNSTINANSNPLIVIDGFPYDESANSVNVLNNINPNDIENITVLRDAAAASIWGARSGNGVIVITTKKGRYNQGIRMHLNSNISIGKIPDLGYIKTLSSSDAIDFENRMFDTGIYDDYDNSYPTFNYFPILPFATEVMLAGQRGDLTSDEVEETLSGMRNIDVRDDVKKYLLQNSINQQYALGFNGGADNYLFYGSVGFDKNRANNIGNEYDRLTVRYDNTFRPFKNFEINGYMNFIQSNEYRNVINFSSFLPVGFGVSPYTRLADEFGNHLPIPYGSLRSAYVDTASFPGLVSWKYYPLDELSLNDNQEKKTDNRVGVGLKYTFLDNFTAEIKYQYQKSISGHRIYYSPETFFVRNLVNGFMQIGDNGSLVYPVPFGGIIDNTNSQLTSRNIRAQINYNKIFNIYSVATLLGVEGREVESDSRRSRNYGYDVNNGTAVNNIDYSTRYFIRPDGISRIAVPNPSSFGGSVNRYVSYFGNAAYSIDNKYILSISGRVDGSNYFGIKTNQKLIPLWSVGGAWELSKENFYNIDWFTSLRIRATYGHNGNTFTSVTAYPTLSYHTNSAVTGNQYADVVSPGNPGLKWEKVEMTNLAVEFTSKGDRISGTFEYYQKKGIDLIGNILTEPTSGFTSLVGNRASIRGNGIDMTINTENFRGKFLWRTSLLLSHSNDKVVDYVNPAADANSYISGQPFVGRPIYSLFSYKWAGLNPTNGDPRVFVADTIASFNEARLAAKSEDLVFHGTATPRFFGAVRNTFVIHGFSLSCNIIYKFSYYFRRSSIDYQRLQTGWGGHSDYSNRWQKPGDENVTYVPSMIFTQNPIRESVYRYSSVLVQPGDHIRLQDIRVSYDIDRLTYRRLPVRNLSVYMYINNVGILWRSNKLGIDPDYGDSTIPPSRSVSFGLSTQF